MNVVRLELTDGSVLDADTDFSTGMLSMAYCAGGEGRVDPRPHVKVVVKGDSDWLRVPMDNIASMECRP